MRRIKKLFIITTLLVSIGGSSSVFAAADSTLSQVIRDIDCTHVTLENGNQLNHPDCQIFPPKFMKLSLVNEKYPVVQGVYDAVHAVTNAVTGQHDLAIEFNGRTFILGRDSELRVNGNIWTLDFSNWQADHPGDDFMPLTPGETYPGRVTAKLKASPSSPEVTQFADFSVTIPKKPIEEIIVIPHIVAEVGRVLARTGISIWLVGAASVSAIVVAFILLLIRKREKERDG